MPRLLLALGAFTGLAAVALSAWGAHAAPGRLAPPELAMFATAVQLLGWHAPALLVAGLLAERSRLAGLAGGLIAAGLLVFVGAVLLRALGGLSLGPAAPIGGIVLLVAWAQLAVSALRRR